MAHMTFLEMQNEVILDRFSEHTSGTRRTSVKRWLNTRYGRLWNSEAWTFRRQMLTPLNLPLGQNQVFVSGLGTVWKLYDISTSLGNYPIELDGLPNEQFWGWDTTMRAIPTAFTALNGVIYFDTIAPSDRTYRLINLPPFIPLSGDSDLAFTPEEHDMTLVVGATAEGLKIEGDPNWQAYEQEWQEAINDLKKNYMTEVGIVHSRPASWPPY